MTQLELEIDFTDVSTPEIDENGNAFYEYDPEWYGEPWDCYWDEH